MTSRPALTRTLWRGWKRLCPRCGEAPLFLPSGILQESCPSCDWRPREQEPNTWFLMYMSTAAITGVFLILMLLVTPSNALLGKIVIASVAMAAFFATHSRRKGVAIAFEYFVASRVS